MRFKYLRRPIRNASAAPQPPRPPPDSSETAESPKVRDAAIERPRRTHWKLRPTSLRALEELARLGRRWLHQDRCSKGATSAPNKIRDAAIERPARSLRNDAAQSAV